MNVIDLSHFIEEGMPVYPGTEPPRLDEANTIEKDGFREKLLTMYSHTGTHMDAPAHILPGAPTLDELPIGTFAGTAVVLDTAGGAEPGSSGGVESGGETRSGGGFIGVDFLRSFEAVSEGADFLLIHTGWDRFWGSEAYYSGYPTLDAEAARWLARKGLKGVGMDCISADPEGSGDLPVHRILLGAGMVIVENLANLGSLPSGRIRFFAMPLKIRGADGSPVRALAEI